MTRRPVSLALVATGACLFGCLDSHSRPHDAGPEPASDAGLCAELVLDVEGWPPEFTELRVRQHIAGSECTAIHFSDRYATELGGRIAWPVRPGHTHFEAQGVVDLPHREVRGATWQTDPFVLRCGESYLWRLDFSGPFEVPAVDEASDRPYGCD